jgi:hypothetical protein
MLLEEGMLFINKMIREQDANAIVMNINNTDEVLMFWYIKTSERIPVKKILDGFDVVKWGCGDENQ